MKMTNWDITMKDKTNYLTPKQIERMLSVCKHPKKWLFIYLGANTGRRISELFLLKPEDVDFDKCIVLWTILKKRNPLKEWVAISHETAKTLFEFKEKFSIEEDQYYFESPLKDEKGEGKPYSRQWAFNAMRDITKRAGVKYRHTKDMKAKISKKGKMFKPIDGWHPHHLRHSFSINFLKNNKTPAAMSALQTLLVHTNFNTTQIYSQFSQDDKVEMLDQAFDKKEVSD